MFRGSCETLTLPRKNSEVTFCALGPNRFEIYHDLSSLSESKDLYFRAFEQSPFPCVILDTATFKILSGNVASEVYGYTRSELSEMRLSDLCILPYGPEHDRYARAHEGVWWVRYKDGRERDVLAVHQQLQPIKDGRMLVYLLEDRPAVRSSATRMARLHQLQVLVRFSSQLAAASDLPDLYRAIDECMRDAFGEMQARSLWINDQRNDRLHLAHAGGHPDEGELFKLVDHPDFRAMLEGTEIRVEDSRRREPFASSPAFAEARSVTLIPMRAGDGLEAVFILCSAKERRTLSDADQRLMLSFGTLAGMVLRRLKLIKELRTTSRLLVEIQDTERQAISRDIHDELGGLLSSLRLMLKMVRSDETAVRKEISDAVDVVDEVIAQIRDISFQLSPLMLTHLGLLPTIESYVKRFSARTRIDVTVHTQGDTDSRYMKTIEVTAYRAIQESLTNASKHSGAEAIQVHINDEGPSLTIHVLDDGRGFEVEEVAISASGRGLRGLRERVSLIGGKLEISSSPGDGTCVSVLLPKEHTD